MRNELQNEDVVTICELAKKYADKDLVQTMGTLFDRDLNLDNKRVFRGNLSGGLAVEDAEHGEYAFFVNDIGAGLNNVNTAWVDYSTWQSSFKVESEDVGEFQLDESTQELDLQWGTSPYVESDATVKLSPIYKLDDNGNETWAVAKYVVSISMDGSAQQYQVRTNNGYVHFLVNGNRYRLNMTSLKVDRLVVQDVLVSTIDFVPTHLPDQLRNNLTQNLKNMVLNQVVQSVVDSNLNSPSQVDIHAHKPLDLYLEMFSDGNSLGNYAVANGLDVESNEGKKFA